MSSGCLFMAQGVLRRTGACSARVLAQASRSLQATSMGLQAGNLQQGPAAFHSGHAGGFAGDAVPFVVGPRGARSAAPSAASRGLCTSSTSAETKEVDQEAATTTMIDGDEPNIKYEKVQNEVSFARASRNRAGEPRVRESERETSGSAWWAPGPSKEERDFGLASFPGGVRPPFARPLPGRGPRFSWC